MTRVAGLDLAAGRGRSALAALDLDTVSGRLQYVAHQHPEGSDAEIVEALCALGPEVLAIDAPLSLPAMVAAALSIPGAPRLSMLPDDASPYLRAAERDPLWRRLGVRPLPVSFLGGLTFRALVLLPRLRATLPETAIIEAFPSGALAALGITRSDDGEHSGPRRAKTTAEARAAVQRGLARYISSLSGLPERTAMPLDADHLDALACALTAAAYLRGTYDAAGEVAEGQIVVPFVSKQDPS
jgi:predicted nuclease with RNAse H fold